MSHPRTAVRGNLLGALGHAARRRRHAARPRRSSDFELILAGLVVGSAIGAVLAVRSR
jgi:NAD/NADP transhydrogenase beta subunit